MASKLQVQVSYATATQEYLRGVEVEEGATIEQAIGLCGVLQDIPGIDLALQPVGIFGKKRPLDTVLRANDRIEIYRPLVADPKDSRRRRADKKAA
jgi:putative ubiquitin-RnfH superfamily antitoxin RatB of RatAB toxin-antitoxin module